MAHHKQIFAPPTHVQFIGRIEVCRNQSRIMSHFTYFPLFPLLLTSTHIPFYLSTSLPLSTYVPIYLPTSTYFSLYLPTPICVGVSSGALGIITLMVLPRIKRPPPPRGCTAPPPAGRQRLGDPDDEGDRAFRRAWGVLFGNSFSLFVHS